MSNAVPESVEDDPPGEGEDRPRRRARRRKKRGKRHLSKLRRGVVGFVFALQLIVALAGLVVLPLYLMYEFIVE